MLSRVFFTATIQLGKDGSPGIPLVTVPPITPKPFQFDCFTTTMLEGADRVTFTTRAMNGDLMSEMSLSRKLVDDWKALHPKRTIPYWTAGRG